MSDSVEHPYVEWIAREAKRPVVVDPAARGRVMAAVRAEGPVRRASIFALSSSLRAIAFERWRGGPQAP